jgi:Tol biopolymer transport system component
MVFTDNSQNGVDAIYVVSSQGGTPECLIPEESGPHADLTWSPDGKKSGVLDDPLAQHWKLLPGQN